MTGLSAGASEDQEQAAGAQGEHRKQVGWNRNEQGSLVVVW